MQYLSLSVLNMMAKANQTNLREIKVLLVDDQPNVRRGLRMRLALEPDITVVGEAGDGVAALELARKLHPNVVVMDLEMPTMDGITATQKLRDLDPDIAIVILSMYGDASTTARARAAGAAAIVEKRQSEQELLTAIRSAAVH